MNTLPLRYGIINVVYGTVPIRRRYGTVMLLLRLRLMMRMMAKVMTMVLVMTKRMAIVFFISSQCDN